MYKVEKLQRRACIIILGKNYVTLDDALKTLNFLTFEEIIFINKAKLVNKIANNTTLIYLNALFQMRVEITLLRSVPNKHFTIPKPKLRILKRSLTYSGVFTVWNTISSEMKNDTLISFEWMFLIKEFLLYHYLHRLMQIYIVCLQIPYIT